MTVDPPRPAAAIVAAVLIAMFICASPSRADTVASLLGNFTINQFCGIDLQRSTVAVRYVVIYGQLPALRELHNADADGNGVTTQAERDAYVGTLSAGFADALRLTVDGVRIPLIASHWSSSLPTEQGGFSLRVEVDFGAALPASSAEHQTAIAFSNQNYLGRIGWHEITVTSPAGITVYDTDAFSNSATNGLTEALQALPEAGPLDERTVHMEVSVARVPPAARLIQARSRSGTQATASPANAAGSEPFGASENAWIARKTHDLVNAISGPRLEPRVALATLLAALLLGAVHALSPGHGKTLVGAYLIGSRGTARHAVYLGLTVTVTHTLGVFLLGFATLYASRFIVPERLFPILSLISAMLVLGMGIVLLVQRGRAASRTLALPAAREAFVFVPFEAAAAGRLGLGLRPAQRHPHTNALGDTHVHSHTDGTMHSHDGGSMHSHLPPGAAGEQVNWKSLLTLGISGGLVPCPSAMVLLLAAIALNKTAYGMLLVLVFSVGLAITLIAVGLTFLYARSRLGKPSSSARWPRWLPVMSAATITLVGVALCLGALRSFG